MIPNYDLFKVTNGEPRWFSSAETLGEARQKVKLADGNDEFVIFNQETQEKISVKPEKPA
jgi:hypothetical protein